MKRWGLGIWESGLVISDDASDLKAAGIESEGPEEVVGLGWGLG